MTRIAEPWERILAALQIFYVDFDLLTDYNTAAVECFKFINGGNEDDTQKKRSPQVAGLGTGFSLYRRSGQPYSR